jgi:hypothetical protein
VLTQTGKPQKTPNPVYAFLAKKYFHNPAETTTLFLSLFPLLQETLNISPQWLFSFAFNNIKTTKRNGII